MSFITSMLKHNGRESVMGSEWIRASTKFFQRCADFHEVCVKWTGEGVILQIFTKVLLDIIMNKLPVSRRPPFIHCLLVAMSDSAARLHILDQHRDSWSWYSQVPPETEQPGRRVKRDASEREVHFIDCRLSSFFTAPHFPPLIRKGCKYRCSTGPCRSLRHVFCLLCRRFFFHLEIYM